MLSYFKFKVSIDVNVVISHNSEGFKLDLHCHLSDWFRYQVTHESDLKNGLITEKIDVLKAKICLNVNVDITNTFQ